MVNEELTKLDAGMPILIGGNRVTRVSPELADAFRPGDHLLVIKKTGELLHVPSSIFALAEEAVSKSLSAFEEQQSASDDQFTEFYNKFSSLLSKETVWEKIRKSNASDIERAKSRGRSTTRLAADDKMRNDMIAGLQEWRDMTSRRDSVIDVVEHKGWQVERIMCPSGVVAFVFEGRPNVIADATGVLRGGNTAVFRIGGDALNTAKAIMTHALKPSLVSAGLPEDSIILLDSTEHAAGWALFADPRLSLAVARGSGRAVDMLGAIAREAGNTVSLHGTGGGWIITDEFADPEVFEMSVFNSCDRKVCNTVNVICIIENKAEILIPRLLSALRRRGETLGHGYRLHIAEGSEEFIPSELFETKVQVYRADGLKEEVTADTISIDKLGVEWEWEQTPEVSVVVAKSLDEGIDLFNKYSPLLVASLLSEEQKSHRKFLKKVNAPFIGNGFTRWVDGQYALRRPELGLSNWQNGRLLARSGLLTGDGVFSIKLRAWQEDPDIHR